VGLFVKERGFHGGHEGLFFFRGMAGEYAIVTDQKAVVYYIIDLVSLGDELCPKAFARAAFPDEREDFNFGKGKK
jgi:hypothetical protein